MNQSHKKNDDLITVRGVLAPHSWDAAYNVKKLLLQAENEEEYLLAEDATSKLLSECCPAFVQVTGRLHRDRNGTRLEVVMYDILNR
ncbi:MAG: hypothetical protein AB7E47_05110 [Desulfovibrionaceae bacterium]